jgi:glycosyltransferase involved in cell wall biosynthesis
VNGAPVPAVSVLMPCYNAADTLDEAAGSLARQTFGNFEVIAVDDGSADGSREILQAWASQDGRFRLISQPHRGIIAALNTGLHACQADWVARMDADDRCHPERLARQMAYLEAHPHTSVVGCLVAAFPAEQVRQGFRIYLEWLNALISDADIRREMFVESPLPHPSVIYRRACVEQAGAYQENGWPEDYDLWLRLYLSEARFAKVPEVLLDWREHPERLTRRDSRYSLENFLRAKAYYLMRGPAAGREAVFIWGAGMMGRRLGKQLERQGAPLAAFIDIDPRKIGSTRRGRPILAPAELPAWWQRYRHPVLLAAVGTRGARPLIRRQLTELGLHEAQDWWLAA